MADSPSPTSIWGFTTGWFTPASLFLLLNLVIGTIALSARFGHKKREHQEVRQLVRAPSLIERVKSINLSFYNCLPPGSEIVTESTTEFVHNTEAEYTAGVDRPAPLERTPSLLERVKSIKLSSFYKSEPENDISGQPELDSLEDMISQEQHHVKRSMSEPRAAAERQGTKMMKKSASERAVAAEEEEEDRESVERRKPATTRLEKTESFGDEGVDAKADDFINRFKQQLKLQRLDSLLRYKEMLRGK